MIKEKNSQKVSNEIFVTRWCKAAKNGKSLGDFVLSSGWAYNWVHGKFRTLLSMGVELPKLKGQRSDYQIESFKLNKIIFEIMGETEGKKKEA